MHGNSLGVLGRLPPPATEDRFEQGQHLKVPTELETLWPIYGPNKGTWAYVKWFTRSPTLFCVFLRSWPASLKILHLKLLFLKIKSDGKRISGIFLLIFSPTKKMSNIFFLHFVHHSFCFKSTHLIDFCHDFTRDTLPGSNQLEMPLLLAVETHCSTL